MTAAMIETTIEAALRALVLAGLVGAALTVLRVRHVPARKAAWTLVLVAAVAMPFLMRAPVVERMLPQRDAWIVAFHRTRTTKADAAVDTPLEVHMSASARVVRSAAETDEVPAAAATPAAGTAPVVDASPMSGAPAAGSDAAPAVRVWTWPSPERMVVFGYLAVAGALLLRLLWGLGAAVRLWMTAEEVSPLDVPEGNVRASEKIVSPVTIGRGIVLPANYTEWERGKLRVVLAHEESHVRQMDFYLQLLAGLYAAVFWFSPLGWWLRRTLAALGETIGDHAGVQAAASRSQYAEIVLEFAALPQRSVAGVAMARKGNLSRRIERMLNEGSAFAEGRVRAAAALLLVPAALFAVTALVRVPQAEAAARAATAQAMSAPAPTQATTGQATTGQAATGQAGTAENQVETVNPEDGQNPAPAPPPASGAPVTPQAAPAPPEPGGDPNQNLVVNVPGLDVPSVNVPPMHLLLSMPPMPQMTQVLGDGKLLTLDGPGPMFLMGPGGAADGDAYHFSSKGDSWAVVDGSGNDVGFFGDGATEGQLGAARRMAKGPFLWFTHDGKSYIVDDAAIVAQIEQLYAPLKEIGSQERALGVQERVLGQMERELGRTERESDTVRVPDLSKEMAAAEAALANLKNEQGQMLSEEKLGEMERQLAQVEARLGMLEARAAMANNFGEKMRALGEQQRQLGEQQRQLGEQERKLTEQAEPQVQAIISESLKNGKATAVK